MTWLDILTFAAALPLMVLILLRGFALEYKRDEAEGQQNREENCLYHAWARSKGPGLRCQLCGKVAGVGL